MRDLDKALDDILAIRSQIAAQTAFRGYGPAAMAATGGLALATGALQSVLLDDPTAQPVVFLSGWVVTAVLAAAIMWFEMKGRLRRHHSGLANALIHNAVEQFLPAAGAGALLAFVVVRQAPEAAWVIPGLWQILAGLGIFASGRSLPRAVAVAGVWYIAAGLSVLVLASDGHVLSPWLMAVPFAVGQILVAAILHRSFGSDDVEA